MSGAVFRVIPAYNEQHRISATLDYVLDYIREHNLSAEIIVVDDGSTDHTSQLVESYTSENASVGLLRTPEHRGKGSAVRAGFSRPREQ